MLIADHRPYNIIKQTKHDTIFKLCSLIQTSVIKGTYLALEHMSKEHGKQGGVIINVSSMAGMIFIISSSVLCIMPV